MWQRLRASQLIILVAAVALLATACSATAGSLLRSDAQPSTLAFEEHNTVLNPGGLVTNSITFDDTVLEYVLFTPTGFGNTDTAPLLIALPPGPQDANSVNEMMNAVFVEQAEQRGWVVASPIAPDGVLFFEGSEDFVPSIVEVLEGIMTIEGGRPHLAGVSNGGISSFRLAAQRPIAYESLTVFPGSPLSETDRQALSILTEIPIAMWVGANDGPWIATSEEAFELLQEFGGDVSYTVVPGEGHVIQSLWRDSTPIWDALSSARLSAG